MTHSQQLSPGAAHESISNRCRELIDLVRSKPSSECVLMLLLPLSLLGKLRLDASAFVIHRVIFNCNFLQPWKSY